MALLRRRYGSHLSEEARKALESCRTPMPPHVLFNPLTRDLAKRMIEADWAATVSQLDFNYSIKDVTVGDVSCVRYETDALGAEPNLIFYLHASAFVWGSPHVNAAAVLPSCRLAQAEGLGVDYSLAPKATFPTQLDEIERVYLAEIEAGRDASRIILMGDSAGGTLALSSLHRWRRKGLPLPAGVVLMSPLVDATASSDTYLTLRAHDPIFGGWGEGGLATVYAMYAPGEDLADPEVSPINGDFAGMPPMLIHVGGREVFLGDAVRLAEKARRAGVDVNLRVFDGLFHLFHMHWSLAEARTAHEDIADFVHKTAPSPRILASLAS